jgi:hypothetical protein
MKRMKKFFVALVFSVPLLIVGGNAISQSLGCPYGPNYYPNQVCFPHLYGLSGLGYPSLYTGNPNQLAGILNARDILSQSLNQLYSGNFSSVPSYGPYYPPYGYGYGYGYGF